MSSQNIDLSSWDTLYTDSLLLVYICNYNDIATNRSDYFVAIKRPLNFAYGLV
jgi:hypothetical protein